MTFLQILVGGLLASAAIAGAFWFAFRSPPHLRGDANALNRDADYAMRNMHDDGHGGFS